jgi:Tol biopolymer transport system component
VQLQRAVQREMADGDSRRAIAEYRRIADRAGSNKAVASQALLRMADAHRKLGDAEAQTIYNRILRDYPDQEAAATARMRVDAGAAVTVTDRLLWTVPAGPPVQLSRVSPDGRNVAFARGSDVMLRELATGRERRVAHFESGTPGPTMAWSPDGRRVAFEFRDAAKEIRVVNADGTGMRTLMAGHRSWARVLDFSPDGSRILASRGEGTGAGDTVVFWLDAADGSRNDLVVREGPGGSGWPRLSPDGRYIAIRRSPGISLLAADGSAEHVISRNGGDLNPAGWSPDGRRLLFVREQSGRLDLWAMPIADGKVDGPAALLYRDFAGGTIENSMARDGSLYYIKAAPGQFETYTASVDFGAGRTLGEPLAEFSRGPGSVFWSADGKQLLYATSPNALVVRTVDGGETREVAIKLRRVVGAALSPDGARLAATALPPQGGSGIFLIDARSGDAQLVAPDPSATGANATNDGPQFSPDGRKLYYRQRAFRSSRIDAMLLERDLATGQERTVATETVADGAAFEILRISPDGRYLAYGTVDRARDPNPFIHIRPIGEGETRSIRIPSAEASTCHPLAWLPDSSALVYHCDAPDAIGESGNATGIVSLADLAPRRLDLRFPTIDSLSIHPDGRRVAFSVRRPGRTELHVLENLLPGSVR